MSSDRSLASKDVKVTLTVSPDTGYYTSSVTYSGDTVKAEVISADGIYSFNMPSEDITVSAVFSEIIYPISYDLKGGSVSPANPETYTITTPDFTLTNPTRVGYEFSGWTGTGIDGTADVVTVLTGSYGAREYTATWTPIIYALKYDEAGGTVTPDNPATYTIETPSFTLENPSRNGYTFAGWKGTDIDGTAEIVTVLQGSTGNRSYTFDGWTGTDLTAKTQRVTIPAGSTGNRAYTANFTPIT